MMIQNNIESVLKNHSRIPVATISKMEEVDIYYEKLKSQGISCIEITLRNDIAWDAIALFKEKYGHEFQVGVGTIVSPDDILNCVKLKVDFMVSPGLTSSMIQQFDFSGIPFLPGVSTPSEIIRGIDSGWQFFKFFPAHLFGGAQALETYSGIFKDVRFCPTGGINGENFEEYLALNNVMSVGGSWLLK
mmetsp:Transcript_19742/g.22871  ORF Transcript_19742/g.22871 Transcript_19742/m.22871 type:complete len:189 (+) Transcript_19742:668-1234(+)